MLKHLVSLSNRLSQLRGDDRGVTSVAYGLMVSLIAIAIIVAVTLVGTQLTNLFNTVAAAL